MRGVFIAAFTTAFLGALAPSSAQTRALHLAGSTHHSGEHSCSQSWATSTESVSFTLDIHAQHAATLVIDRTHRTRGGSQPMFDEGASPPSVLQRHDLVTLTGTATQGAHAIDLRMISIIHQTAYWQGEGTLPLGAPTTRAVALNVHCDEASLPVHAAVQFGTQSPSETESTEATSAYTCRFTDPPSAGWSAFLTEYVEHLFPLAHRPIMRVESDGPFHHGPFYRFIAP